MKAKNSIWKNKLAKTTFFMTVILVAALFLGTAASAGLTSSTTPTQNKNNKLPILSKAGPTAGLASYQCLNTHPDYQPFTPSVPFGDVIFTQTYYTPDESWNFITSSSGLGYVVQEDFTALSDDIGDVHWYGLSLMWSSGWTPVDPTGTTYEIIFYEDNGGSPGAVVATFSDLEPTVVDTGLLYGGSYPMWYWEITLDSSVALSSGGWISIQSTYSPANGNFLWACGPDGNFNALQNGASTGANTAYDLTAPDIQYDHDISISSIVKPASGNAAPITPVVKVKNNGLYTETNVPVELLIGKEVITGTVENFEATNGGYTHFPKTIDAWEWGAPTSGPMAAYSGSNVWATILAGNYPNGMWCSLVTPQFTVPSGAEFKFWQWYYFESSFDGGNVKISTDGGSTWTLINPDGGYPSTMPNNPYMTGQACYNGQSAGWVQAAFDLSAYEGQLVQIMWECASDSSVTYPGWYIDDVGFSIVSWANVYDQTVIIPSIDPATITELTFPTWTPADLGTVENTNINYNAEAYNLFADDNANNDYKAKAFTLHYGYFNDVKVDAINSPVNGLAAPQIPEVRISNVGQFDQSANVNMQIGKIVYGAQWTQEEPTEWQQVNSNVAGGTAPEAYLPYYVITGDYAYLMSCPIDTSALSTLTLSFRSMINNYAGGYNCYVKSRSSESDPWTDVTPWANPISNSIPAAQYTVDITGDISTTTQVEFEFSGYYFNLNYWYVDDFVCGAYSTDFSGNFPPVQISTIVEYDQTTTVDIAAGASMNVTLPLWTPADLPFSTSIDYRADVTVTLNGFTPIYNYGFEDWVPPVPPGPVVFPPAGWTTINANGDSVVWTQYAYGAHTGTYCASISYHYPTDDDWLTTQPVMIPGGGGQFSFWWMCGSTYYAEHFKVYYSTSGNTVADFTGPNGHLIGDITYNTDTNWHQFTYAMTGPEQVWFAVYILSADALRLSVDDFAFPDGTTQGFDEGTPAVPGHWPGWTLTNYGTTTDQWFGVTSGTYPTCSPPEGIYMAEYNSFSISSGNSAELDQTGAPVDFSSATQMKFKMMHDTGYSSSADVIYPLLSADGVNFWYDGTGFYRYDGSTGWKVETMDYSFLISYLGGPGSYYIGFYAVSAYGNNIFIDDISVSEFSVIPDGNPADNTMSKTFTLSYEHDVGVTAITEPTGPIAKADAYLQYDNGVYANAFGSTTGQIYGANRFTPDEVGAYVGWYLDTIMWKHYGAESFTGEVRVYDAGSTTAPGPMITSEPFTVTGAGWFNITLSTPVLITGSDIWLCVEGTHASGQYPLECSAPGISLKSAFFSSDEVTWYDLPGLGYDVAWETRGHVAEVAPPGGNWPPGTYPVEGIVQNLGVTYDESNFDVNAQIKAPNGTIFYDNTVTVTDVLAPGATAIVGFPDFTIPDVASWEGKYTLTIKTMLAGDDHSGNDKKTLSFTIERPDIYPPVTTYSISGTMGQNGWYISHPVVTLTAIDPDGKWPSGVNHTYIKIDSGAWTEYTVPVTIPGDGTHTVQYYSVDKAGNVEDTHTAPAFKVDTTPPVWNSYTFTAQNAMKNKWLCEADVTDATSGIVLVEFYVDDALVGNATTTPYTFLFEGKPTNNSQAIAYDAAGNSALSPVATSFEMNQQQQSQPTLKLNLQTKLI